MSLLDMQNNETTDITVNGKTFTNTTAMPYELGVLNAYHSTLYNGGKPREGKVSTTGIIGALKPLILSILNPDLEQTLDVSTLTASSRGTIMHTGLETALKALDTGYVVEQRVNRVVNEWVVSGEIDVLTPDKQIKDLKTTSSYTMTKLKADMDLLEAGMSIEEMAQITPTYYKYIMQLSIYKYLLNNEEIKPYGSLLFILNHGGFEGLPLNSETTIPLLPNEAVEEFLFNRIETIKQHLKDGTLPRCSDVERGLIAGTHKITRYSPKTFKYFTAKGSKSNSLAELHEWMSSHGKLGDEIVSTPDKYVMCEWCKVKEICEQYMETQT